MERQSEIATNLSEVKFDIETACQKYGRNSKEVNLIVVTKTWPASDVEILADLGVTDVGENRDQEAKPKHDAVKANLTWHAIGQLQTNKAKSVANWADVVHSIDRVELVKALAKAVVNRTSVLKCLIQVDLDPTPRDIRGGAQLSEVTQLADLISDTPNLEFSGLMCVAPLNLDPEPAFAQLAMKFEKITETYPFAKWMSAGMSGDYELAIKHGATHLRIGSSILGHRAIKG